MLEDDFIKTNRFVELDRINFNTFSVEYAKQYQSICSEIDVVCKSICLFINNSSNAKNMEEYTSIILNKCIDITSKEIIIRKRNQLLLIPFKEWHVNPYKSPSWWGKYNKVKHNRVVEFPNANLINVLNSLAGLYLLEMYFLKNICGNDENAPDIPDEESSLFKIKDWETKYIGLTGDFMFRVMD